ncbi:hypothetical protein [Winogradskyella tangerina]|uniref:hypothetical protein n=1 Tax=Winogradskyella tangerina TaxID=2023240 RepID=UPI000DBE2DD9|nr:hypothetical protein [Winogradskyella tangerina]
MKKIFLLLLISLGFFSCSTDDDSYNNDPTPESSVVRLLSVNAITNQIELLNLGNSTVNVADYYLCLGPGRYPRVGDIAVGSTNLAPNQRVILNYELNEAAEGILLFTTNTFTSTDPEVLLDYIQYGAPNQVRVENAVIAGRWDNEANFIDGGSPYTFTGTADQFGSGFWESTFIESRVVRITEVNTTTNEIELSNFGNVSVNVGNYWLCLGPGNYEQISNIASGTTDLAPNQTVSITYNLGTAEGVGIFATNTFGSTDPEVLLDYMQYGGANQDRVNQAVQAGRWDSETNFVQGASPYRFNGNAADIGVTFWE